jgi:hypothetical protein
MSCTICTSLKGMVKMNKKPSYRTLAFEFWLLVCCNWTEDEQDKLRNAAKAMDIDNYNKKV